MHLFNYFKILSLQKVIVGDVVVTTNNTIGTIIEETDTCFKIVPGYRNKKGWSVCHNMQISFVPKNTKDIEWIAVDNRSPFHTLMTQHNWNFNTSFDAILDSVVVKPKDEITVGDTFIAAKTSRLPALYITTVLKHPHIVQDAAHIVQELNIVHDGSSTSSSGAYHDTTRACLATYGENWIVVSSNTVFLTHINCYDTIISRLENCINRTYNNNTLEEALLDLQTIDNYEQFCDHPTIMSKVATVTQFFSNGIDKLITEIELGHRDKSRGGSNLESLYIHYHKNDRIKQAVTQRQGSAMITHRNTLLSRIKETNPEKIFSASELNIPIYLMELQKREYILRIVIGFDIIPVEVVKLIRVCKVKRGQTSYYIKNFLKKQSLDEEKQLELKYLLQLDIPDFDESAKVEFRKKMVRFVIDVLTNVLEIIVSNRYKERISHNTNINELFEFMSEYIKDDLLTLKPCKELYELYIKAIDETN